MPKYNTVHLPAGNTLSFTTDAVTSGTYTRRGNPGGTVYSPVAMNVSTTTTIGPFNEPRNYEFSYQGNDFATTQAYSGIFDSTDEAAYVTKAATATTGFGFVIDEDDMTTDSATKVPTQQSVKAYVDSQAAPAYPDASFTPVLVGAGDAGEGTYSLQSGRYVTIGKLTHVNIAIVWTAHTGSGQFKITGLPVASKTGIVQRFTGQPVSVAGAVSPFFGELASNSTELALTYVNGSTRGTVDVEAAGEFYLSFSYITD